MEVGPVSDDVDRIGKDGIEGGIVFVGVEVDKVDRAL